MASLSKADSRRMYSWWWNSHISPKNSKWLQENLTDVDIKVKAMIKLIEEDADSFARRAEMYYKKRPELMKLVEELYRAYRALAERYDHATGTLRQAHKTMAEVFPNQVPVMCDDSSANSPYDGDPQTPDSRTTSHTFLDNEESQKDLPELSRRRLEFSDSEDTNNKHRSRAQPVSEFENVGMTDREIELLKEALAKLEDEKEAGLKQYQESSERLSKLESEISHAEEDSRELANRASKADAEAQTLKDALQKLEFEKELSLEKLSNLENALSHAQENILEGENVTGILKQELARLKDERDATHDKYKQSIDTQSELEKKLMEADKEASKFRERAEKAESEVETLKGVIGKLMAEKEAQALLYQQCLETISSLELRLACAEEEAKRLNSEVDNGISLLKSTEEQCLMLEKSNKTLHMELESTVLKMGTQTLELTEKQKELGRLWTCIQEERIRFVEAETALQTLQQLRAQSQEELRSSAAELQNRARILLDIESRNKLLEGEIQKQIEENKNLDELNISSAISLKDMQSEICSLKESNSKLDEEVDLRVDQRNALQQEIYCLKEELNELNKNLQELQNENSNLKEHMHTEKSTKAALLEKLEIMGQLLEKNVVLENSLSDLGDELEGVRSKLKALEESYRCLSEEKSTLAVEKANLLGQLQVTTDNLSQVSEKNTVLENSLFDAHVKLEVLKQKSKSFEDSCQLLADEKSALINEKGLLFSQIEITEKRLKNLELKYSDLEKKYSEMEKERESTLCKVEELHERNVTFAQKNDKQLRSMNGQIQILQEESHNKTKEFEEELDKAFGSEIEISILMGCVKDLEEKNFSLLNDCHKLLEAASKLSESENQVKIKSFADQNDRLRTGMHQLLKVSGLSLNSGIENGQEKTCFDSICKNFESKNHTLIENEDKNTELVVEISILVTLLRQLKTEVAELTAEKCGFQKDLRFRAEKILEFQLAARKLSETNKELRSKVSEGIANEEMLRTQLENLHGELSIVQGAYRTLQMENSVVLEDKKSLTKDNFQMKNRISLLEEENNVIFDEVLSQGILSHTLKNNLDEKQAKINGLAEEMSTVEKKLEGLRTENLHKLHQLTEYQEKTKRAEETLRLELQNEKDKIRLLETHALAGYGDLQASTICEVVLEEKIHELMKICSSLQEENTSKDVNTELLKKRTNVLERENGDLQAHLAAYGPAVESLRDCVISLENHTSIRTKIPESENEDAKGAESVTVERDTFIELQDLQSKVKSIEIDVAEMQMLKMQEKLEADAKIESAMRQIEELSSQKNSRIAKTSEISELDVGILPKDIMLDQASECSSYGISKRGPIEGETWETADKNGHNPTASDVSLDMVDKLEVSRRFQEPRDDGNRRKVLERLNSDVLKLTNLQITIEDLKRKVDITGKSRRGKAMIECETLKGQLMEVESAIHKLYELNGKLVKHIEGNSSTKELSESESMRRKKVSEQARRVSEKIGRLQLEVQKIQFVLVKLDGENDIKGKTGFLDTQKRVLLKDYLYGGGERTKASISGGSRRKKGHFCACVEPSTKGD